MLTAKFTYALEVGDLLHGTVGAHHQAVQRRRDQRADALQRQALVHLQVQLRLIGDRQIGLTGGDQLWRVGGVGGGDDFDLKPLVLEEALFLRDDDRGVVGVHEPVKDQRQLVGGQRRLRQQREGGGKGKVLHRSSPKARRVISPGQRRASAAAARHALRPERQVSTTRWPGRGSGPTSP